MKVNFQTGVDCLGFPTITTHLIQVVKKTKSTGNLYNGKTISYLEVVQSNSKIC